MKAVFCNFLDSQDKNGAITLKPLGYAKNTVHKPTLPGWKDIVTEIVIDKTYTKGLGEIDKREFEQVKKNKLSQWRS